MKQIRTMIVDDQADIRVLLRLLLRIANDGVEVGCEASNGTECLTMIDACDPLVVVIDHMMPGLNGVETASQIMVKRPTQIVILCTAYLDDDIERSARAAGVAHVLHKDDVTTLPTVIRTLVA